ncbi:MAG: ABC transporter permease [Acaryochloridaceae cyanobacterium RU_4_10]|nr:ABC transporter permease [Acaryochloridaceae cyanobacterium RU_4_10]
MNIVRVWAIGTNVFREVFRERVLYVAALFGVALTIAVLLLNEVSGGAEGKISLDVGLAGISLLGLTVAAFMGAGLINKEIEKKTALVLIAKPMSRSEFILGKHLGLTSILGVLVALMNLMLFAVMAWRGIPFSWTSLSVCGLYLILELSLMTAVALLFGVFTSSLIATILTFAVYLMGHFSPNLVTLSQTIKTDSIKSIVKGIYLIFPDLSRLDLKNLAVYGVLPDSGTMALNAGYGVLYIILLLAIASLIFSRREF